MMPRVMDPRRRPGGRGVLLRPVVDERVKPVLGRVCRGWPGVPAAVRGGSRRSAAAGSILRIGAACSGGT